MSVHIPPCSRLLAILGALAFTASVAVAQDAGSTKTQPAATSNGSPAPAGAGTNESPPKPRKKAPSGGEAAKVSTAEKKPKPGQYATEAEARSHCRGTVVWVDQDHFNHYPGSREWAKKPGAFACESGAAD